MSVIISSTRSSIKPAAFFPPTSGTCTGGCFPPSSGLLPAVVSSSAAVTVLPGSAFSGSGWLVVDWFGSSCRPGSASVPGPVPGPWPGPAVVGDVLGPGQQLVPGLELGQLLGLVLGLELEQQLELGLQLGLVQLPWLLFPPPLSSVELS